MDTTNSDAAFWIAGYTDYLRNVMGAVDATRLRHMPTVRRFIAAHSSQGIPDWTGLSVQGVTDFIRAEAATRTGHGRAAPGSATRSFLRFLAWRGVAPSGLDRAIPAIRRARHASLPTHLSQEQLARLLQRPAVFSPAANRDRAILSLLAGLGLRAGEVATLDLDDLDWIRDNSACTPGKAAASGCCRCPGKLALRWPSISSTAARSNLIAGCSSLSLIQRGFYKPRQSARSCGAIWCVPASRSGG